MNSCGITEVFIRPLIRPGLHFFLSPLSRFTSSSQSWRNVLIGVVLVGLLPACGPTLKHYGGVERSLRVGDPQKAVQLVEHAEADYDDNSHLLYLMDLGMTLHLAGQYEESNARLEEADDLVEEQYTKRVRDEASAILVNESELPYRGDPYEHVMINVIKALNYALLQKLPDALVEARRIDHRLNVLTDSVDKDEYHEDPFARYLTGVLYEASGDLNNAFIAYRKAQEAYTLVQSWSHITLPEILKKDLLRVTKALHLSEEYQQYHEAFPDVPEPDAYDESRAQVVVLSYNGRGPTKEDIFLDVPLGLNALQLVAISKFGFGGSSRRTRGRDAVLYGLQGRIVRVALPRLVPHPSTVAYSRIQAKEPTANHETTTQRVYDVGATAKKNLEDQFPTLMVRAAARSALKYGAAEAAGYGTRAAVNGDEGELIAFLVMAIAKMIAIASEEADIRTWQTLPGEIQIGRLWLTPGEYTVTMEPFNNGGKPLPSSSTHNFSLSAGETRFITQRILD